MKSVLISIRPKWCEMIASGKKTIEVRKTRPKIETPFKCYIYCAMGDVIRFQGRRTKATKLTFWMGRAMNHESPGRYTGNGAVIGEFVCDNAEVLFDTNGNPENYMTDILPSILQKTALSYDEFGAYVGSRADKNSIYGWHISGLKIYDKPMNVGEFHHCGEN